jgi:hypothetical protein
MYAAVPRIIPACVIAGVVIVGDCDAFAAEAGGFIAFASRRVAEGNCTPPLSQIRT